MSHLRRPHLRRVLVAACGGLLAAASPAPSAAQDAPLVLRTAEAPLAPAEHARLRGEARALLDQRAFAPAVERTRRLVASAPLDGGVWDMHAFALEELDRCVEALDARARVLAVGFGNRASSLTRLARCHARLGRPDSAFARMQDALDARLENRALVALDPAFAPLHQDARWPAIAGRAVPGEPVARDERWRRDLDFWLSEARRLHADPAAPARSPALVRAADSLRARIPALSDGQVALGLLRLATMLGDGHTSVETRLPRLPIELHWFSDGLFVTGGTGEAAEWVGARVERIGDLTPEAAMRAVAAYVPRDNDMGLLAGGPALLGAPVVLHAIGASRDTATATLTLRTRAGATRTVTLSATTAGPAPRRLRANAPGPAGGAARTPLYLQDTSLFWMRHLTTTRTLYVQYNAVAEPPGQTTVQMADALTRATARGVDHLVLDLRHNGGGNTFLYPPLLNAIIQFAHGRAGRRVLVIVGRYTFSAAQNLASTLDRYLPVTFVGEPTGSAPNFVGESPPVVLPYSGLRAPISSRVHYNADFTDSRRWIAPQLPAPLRSADYFAQRDPALEAVLAVVGAATGP